IRLRRHQQDLSMKDLAEMSGMSKQTIVEIESNRGNPTIETLERISAALGTTVRALVSDVGVDVLLKTEARAEWQTQRELDMRRLALEYGSGYVLNSRIRLDGSRHSRKQFQGSRGMLRHCYVIEGRVELGPEGGT